VDFGKLSITLFKLQTEVMDGKLHIISIAPVRKGRSLNANAYSWKLQDDIAKALKTSVDEIHNKFVMEYGVMETYSILKDAWESAKRLFDYHKVLGESELNGKTYVHARVGLGTHTYNTKEMARFIDGVVEEANALGIETKTPTEIAKLKSLWEVQSDN
jgi:hypothetical protein